MLDRAAAIHNLTMLHLHEIQTLQVEGNRLIPGSLSTEQRAAVLEVIRNTFAFAARLEKSPLSLRVKTGEFDKFFEYVSAGTILASLPPELVAEVNALPLAKTVETHERGELECWGELIPVDLTIVCAVSSYLNQLFQPLPSGDEPKRACIDCSPKILREVINWLHATTSLTQFECNSSVLAVADLLSIPALDVALAKQWRCDDYDLNQLLLLNSCPRILCHLLENFPIEKRLHTLNQLLTVPHKDPSEAAALESPTQLEQLLVELINRQAMTFSDLLVLMGSVDQINSQFSEAFFQQLQILNLVKFPSLTHLEISQLLTRCRNLLLLALPPSVEGNLLTHLKGLPKLETLILDNCRRLSSDSLKNLVHTNYLKGLSLQGCTQLEPNSLAYLRHVPFIEFLNLTGCTTLSGKLEILKPLTELKYLILNNLGKIPNLAFIKSLQKLQALDLGYSSLPPNSLIHLGERPDLWYLSLLSCTSLSNDCLTALRSLPNLTHLNLSGCVQLDPLNPIQLKDHLPRLQHLGFLSTGAPPETGSGLISQFPSLKSVVVSATDLPQSYQIHPSIQRLERWPNYLEYSLYHPSSQQHPISDLNDTN